MNEISEAEFKLSRRVYNIILFSGLIWLLLIFLAPLLASMGGVFEGVSSVIYLFFSKVCHQSDSRSFHLLEHPLGVCSRCSGIYCGFLLGTIIYPFRYKLSNIYPPSLFLLIIPVLLMLADVSLDLFNILPNTFLTRSLTGFLTGFALAFFIIPGFVKFFREVYSFLRNKVSI